MLHYTQVAVLVASHCAASLLQGLSPLEYDVARGVPIHIGGGGNTSFFHDGLEVCQVPVGVYHKTKQRCSTPQHSHTLRIRYYILNLKPFFLSFFAMIG